MVEDAKAARDRRLAEALRANLKRRKAAKSKTPESRTAQAVDGAAEAETLAGHPAPAERDS